MRRDEPERRWRCGAQAPVAKAGNRGGWCGARGRADAQHALGRRRGSARRHYGLLPGAWLTEACSALSGAADALARKAEPAPAWKVNRTGHAKRGPPPQGKRRDGAPEGAAGPRSWAGCLRPDFPETGSTARRATGAPDSAPASSGAPSPLTLFGETETKALARAPRPSGPAERWLAPVIPGPSEARSPESITTGQENGIQTERRG